MDYQPTKVHIILCTFTQASKVNIDLFKNISGENAWNLVPSQSLLPELKNVPANMLYKIVVEKFHEGLFLYSAVVPSGLITGIQNDLIL